MLLDQSWTLSHWFLRCWNVLERNLWEFSLWSCFLPGWVWVLLKEKQIQMKGKLFPLYQYFRSKFHLQLYLCCNYSRGKRGQNLSFDAQMLWSTLSMRQDLNWFFPVTCCLLIYFSNVLINSLRNGWKGPECKFIVMLLLFRQFRVKYYMYFERDKLNSRTLYFTTLPQLLCISIVVMKL